MTEIANRLAEGDYDGLARDGFVSYTNDPADRSIGTWIDTCPATLVPLPDQAWELSDAIETAVPGTWSVVVPLFTEEEGRSDLSMEATVTDIGNEVWAVIDGAHVL